MEQNKLSSKPFKHIFHFTDIKNISFLTEYIPTINILNSKLQTKDIYTKLDNTSLTIFQRLKKQPLFFSKFYPLINQQ